MTSVHVRGFECLDGEEDSECGTRLRGVRRVQVASEFFVGSRPENCSNCHSQVTPSLPVSAFNPAMLDQILGLPLAR